MKILKFFRFKYLKKKKFFNLFIEIKTFLKLKNFKNFNLYKEFYINLFYYNNYKLNNNYIKCFIYKKKKIYNKKRFFFIIKYNKLILNNLKNKINFYLHSPNIKYYSKI